MTAPQQGINDPRILLLQSNFAGSVLGEWGLPQPPLAYSVYGQLAGRAGQAALRFNAQWLEGAVQGYLLGNGHRLYSPLFMRFVSPDALSPFDKGGGNAYAYCEGDPVNNIDPSGRVKLFSLRKFLNPDLKTGVTAAASELNLSKKLLKEQFRETKDPQWPLSTSTSRQFTHDGNVYLITKRLGQSAIFEHLGQSRKPRDYRSIRKAYLIPDPQFGSMDNSLDNQNSNRSRADEAMQSDDGQRDYVVIPVRRDSARTEQ